MCVCVCMQDFGLMHQAIAQLAFSHYGLPACSRDPHLARVKRKKPILVRPGLARNAAQPTRLIQRVDDMGLGGAKKDRHRLALPPPEKAVFLIARPGVGDLQRAGGRMSDSVCCLSPWPTCREFRPIFVPSLLHSTFASTEVGCVASLLGQRKGSLPSCD